MKHLFLFAILLSSFIGGTSLAKNFAELAKYQVKLVSHEITIENQSSTAWSFPSLFNEAVAGADSACLIAGWEGVRTSSKGTCEREELKDPGLIAIKCNGSGTVLCNPEVFGDGVCITPAPGAKHWTKSCEDQMLSKLSIQNHDISSLSDKDFSKINDALIQNHWDYLSATDALSIYCGKTRAQHPAFNDDCEKIHEDFLEIEKKSISLLANLPKPNLTLPKTSPSIKITGKTSNQCGYVNLADKTGPVKNQGVLGDCYSFTAVELMNYGAPPNEQISTISTAVQFGEYYENTHAGKKIGTPTGSEPNIDGFYGGYIGQAVQAARSEGACLNKDVESYGYGDSIALLEMENQFKILESPQCASVQTAAFKSINDFAEAVFQNLTKKYKKKSKEEYKFAERNSHFIATVMTDKSIAPEDRFQAYIRLIVDADCKKQAIALPSWAVGTPKDFSMNANDPKQSATFLKNAFNYINDNLDQGYPTGVGYDPTGLIKKPGPPEGHASLVVGRNYIQGSTPEKTGCYLYVKNSWGTSFPGSTLDGLEAQPAIDKDGKPMPGYYMVKDEVFANHIHDFANLGNDPKVPSTQ